MIMIIITIYIHAYTVYWILLALSTSVVVVELFLLPTSCTVLNTLQHCRHALTLLMQMMFILSFLI